MSRSQYIRRRIPRMSVFTIITLILLLILATIRPEQLQVVVYKAGLVTLGAVLGYWIDRSLFLVDARPGECSLYVSSDSARFRIVGSWIRRALIVMACILGLTLGL